MRDINFEFEILECATKWKNHELHKNRIEYFIILKIPIELIISKL